MTTTKKSKKPERTPCSDECKKGAVKLADTGGATQAGTAVSARGAVLA